jgi:hypothetical protein
MYVSTDLHVFMSIYPFKADNMSVRRIRPELGRLPAWRQLEATLAERFSGDAAISRLNQSRIHLTQPTQENNQVT